MKQAIPSIHLFGGSQFCELKPLVFTENGMVDHVAYQRSSVPGVNHHLVAALENTLDVEIEILNRAGCCR